MLRLGAPWVLCYDIADDGQGQNLLAADVQREVETILLARGAIAWGASPPCSSFSEAVTPPCRSKRCPRGLPHLSANLHASIQAGNAIPRRLAKLYWLTLPLDVPCWIENPWRSWFWRQPEWRRIIRSSRRTLCIDPFFVADFCRYRLPWRKRTAFFLPSLPLAGQRELCLRNHQHIILRGHVRSTHLTKLAEPYPFGLALKLSRACVVAARTRLAFHCCRLLAPDDDTPGPSSHARKNAGHSSTLRAGNSSGGRPLLASRRCSASHLRGGAVVRLATAGVTEV